MFRKQALLFAAPLFLAAMAGAASCTELETVSRPLSPKVFQTRSHKTIILSETHPAGLSISTIKITTKDFEHNISETFEDVDPVSDILMGDLDRNGFDEIYIILVSQGSGSYGTVMAFASNRDKSLSMIHFPGTEQNKTVFEGYMGHDAFVIEANKLVRTFPVYQKTDTNQHPTGGKRKVIYGLYPGEAMWQLKVEKSKMLMNQPGT